MAKEIEGGNVHVRVCVCVGWKGMLGLWKVWEPEHCLAPASAQPFKSRSEAFVNAVALCGLHT